MLIYADQNHGIDSKYCWILINVDQFFFIDWHWDSFWLFLIGIDRQWLTLGIDRYWYWFWYWSWYFYRERSTNMVGRPGVRWWPFCTQYTWGQLKVTYTDLDIQDTSICGHWTKFQQTDRYVYTGKPKQTYTLPNFHYYHNSHCVNLPFRRNLLDTIIIFLIMDELPGKTPRGNPCYSLQGFPMGLTPQVIPCFIVRILGECTF